MPLSRDAYKLWALLQAGVGVELTLRDLALMLGVSKSKTKAAIFELEREGFLTVQEGR